MIAVRCQNPSCSKTLDVATHRTVHAAVNTHRWRVIDGELFCERCASEGEE